MNINIKNKLAYYNYFIEEKIEAGIVLKGSEIKSIREGNAILKDSYCKIINLEAFLVNSFINYYDKANRFNHDPRRIRKLLLHKRQILKLDKAVYIQRYSIIPLKIYIKKGYAKVQIAIAKGKKLYDKREEKKEKTTKRYINKYLKYKNIF